MDKAGYIVRKYILMTFMIVCALAAVLSGCAGSRQTENSELHSSGSAGDSAGSAAGSDEEEELQPAAGEEKTMTEDIAGEEENMDEKMIVEVNGTRFTASLENNEAVNTLVEMMQENPVTIQMSDYSGFEKVGSLGTSLPTSNRQTTTQSGDIVLYQGKQIVIFYGSNSWSYTRLGKIDDLTGWKDALGNGDVAVTFSLDE